MPPLLRKAGELQHHSYCWRANRSSNSHHFTVQPVSGHISNHIAEQRVNLVTKLIFPHLREGTFFPVLEVEIYTFWSPFQNCIKRRGGKGPCVKYVPVRVPCIVIQVCLKWQSHAHQRSILNQIWIQGHVWGVLEFLPWNVKLYLSSIFSS